MKSNDANYLIFDNTKLGSLIDWYLKISIRKMLLNSLNHFDNQISERIIPLIK